MTIIYCNLWWPYLSDQLDELDQLDKDFQKNSIRFKAGIFILSHTEIILAIIEGFGVSPSEKQTTTSFQEQIWRTLALFVGPLVTLFRLLVVSALPLSLPVHHGFFRFTSGATQADLLATSVAAESFWSTYFFKHLTVWPNQWSHDAILWRHCDRQIEIPPT